MRWVVRLGKVVYSAKGRRESKLLSLVAALILGIGVFLTPSVASLPNVILTSSTSPNSSNSNIGSSVALKTASTSSYSKLPLSSGGSLVNSPASQKLGFGVTTFQPPSDSQRVSGTTSELTSCSTPSSCEEVFTYGASGRLLIGASGVVSGIVSSPVTVPLPNGAISARSVDFLRCPSATFCVMVGTYQSLTSGLQIFAVQFDGTKWSQSVAIPSPSDYVSQGEGSLSITGLECGSTTFCEIVGSYNTANSGTEIFTATFNGSQWTPSSRLALPTNADTTTNQNAYSSSLQCPSSNFCEIAGTYVSQNNGTQLFTASNIGSSWSTSNTLPLPSGAATDSSQSAYVGNLQCVSANFCALVGTYVAGNTYPFVVTFDGATWGAATELVLPNDADLVNGPSSTFNSLVCTSSKFCLTAGAYLTTSNGNQVAAAHFDGTTWSQASEIVLPPLVSTTLSQFAQLDAITCTSSQFCAISGTYYADSNLGEIFASTYNGSTWSNASEIKLPSNQNTSYSQYVNVAGISCATTLSCEISGNYSTASNGTQPITASFDGTTWTSASQLELPSDAATGSQQNSTVSSIQCSTTNCFIVGKYITTSGVTGQYSSNLNGSTWMQASQIVLPQDAKLTSSYGLGSPIVSCPAISFCEAAGSYTTPASSTLIYTSTYSGSSWLNGTVLQLPSDAVSTNQRAYVLQLSCASAKLCELVGTYQNSTLNAGYFSATFNGTNWSQAVTFSLPSNYSTGQNVSFTSLQCTSSTFCATAGTYRTDISQLFTAEGFVATFDGSSWKQAVEVTPPSNAEPFSSRLTVELTALSCVSSNFCIAGGNYNTNSVPPQTQTFTSQFDGTNWSQGSEISLPTNPAPLFNTSSQIRSISCATTSFCELAGTYEIAGFQYVPFTSTYSQGGWSAGTEVSLPSDALTSRQFTSSTSVACSSSNFCELTGSFYTNSGSSTFTSTFDGTNWSAASERALPSDASTTPNADPLSLACPTDGTCYLISRYQNSNGVGSRLIDILSNGSWESPSELTLPVNSDPNRSFSNSSLQCSSGTYCTFVGEYFDYVGGANTFAGVIAPIPTIASVSPSTGSANGGVSVSITGSGFTNASGVNFGNVPATSYTVVSDSTIMAVVPASITGPVDVTVSGPSGISATNPQDVFTYTAAAPSSIASLGYWLVASDGGVFNYGSAGFYGSAGNINLNKPIVGIASTPDGKGYWLVASDGGVFNYGDAGFYGSAGNVALNKPIVGISPTPDGKGYWLVASDGGIFNYGDAGFYGSAGNISLNKPVVGVASTPDGKGYWLVASDGGIFNYGDAGFYGSAGNIALNKPVVGVASLDGIV